MYPDPSQNGWQNQPPGQPGYGQPVRQAPPYGQAFDHPPAAAGGVICPKCQIPSDSVKSYTMMSFLIFILIGAWWRTKRVVACASCMRGELLVSSGINLFTANLLSPFVLCWHAVLLLMTFEKGHSADILNRLR